MEPHLPDIPAEWDHLASKAAGMGPLQEDYRIRPWRLLLRVTAPLFVLAGIALLGLAAWESSEGFREFCLGFWEGVRNAHGRRNPFRRSRVILLGGLFILVLGIAGMLSTEELEQTARDIAARPEIWEPLVLVDRERRRYQLLYEDERMDAWVLSWMPGQATGFHDHYISGLGLCVASGGVREDLLRYDGEDVTRHLRAGDSRRGDPGYIHRVVHDVGEPAVTIHVYSPRLDWVGQYRMDENGILRREPSPGRNELRPQLIAEGALSGVLERF